MEKKLDLSLYITWEQLVKNLDKKIDERWKLLKKQLKDDRKNFKANSNIAYV